jgi:archaellum component FlaF (FlaF/FlaG flagellin family)
MPVIAIIVIIIFMVLNLLFDLAYVITKNKYIKVMEAQNVLLWSAVEQSKQLIAEAIKETEKVNAKTQEVRITLDGEQLFNNLKRDTKQEETK